MAYIQKYCYRTITDCALLPVLSFTAIQNVINDHSHADEYYKLGKL